MTFRISAPVTTTLPLMGVWIHDPSDAEATIRWYLYGASQRGDSLDTMGQMSFYAGRQDPVVDFGEHAELTVDVGVDIPSGSTWREDLEALEGFARLRQTLCFRDNRGRAIFGTLEGLKRKDQDWGTQASFTITQVHYARELVP